MNILCSTGTCGTLKAEAPLLHFSCNTTPSLGNQHVSPTSPQGKKKKKTNQKEEDKYAILGYVEAGAQAVVKG